MELPKFKIYRQISREAGWGAPTFFTPVVWEQLIFLKQMGGHLFWNIFLERGGHYLEVKCLNISPSIEDSHMGPIFICHGDEVKRKI